MGADIRRRGYQQVYAYGPSFGGVILLNAAAAGLKLDKLVIDSVPAELHEYDCDNSIAPSAVFGPSCPGIVGFVSDRDQEVPPKDQQALLSRLQAQSCGGHVVHLHLAAHAPNDKPGTPGEVERTAKLAAEFGQE